MTTAKRTNDCDVWGEFKYTSGCRAMCSQTAATTDARNMWKEMHLRCDYTFART
jgi:hypothetical protein